MNSNIEQKETPLGTVRRLLRERQGQRRLHVNRKVLEGALDEVLRMQMAHSKACDKYDIKIGQLMDHMKGWIEHQHGEAVFETEARLNKLADRMESVAAHLSTAELIALVRGGAFDAKLVK